MLPLLSLWLFCSISPFQTFLKLFWRAFCKRLGGLYRFIFTGRLFGHAHLSGFLVSWDDPGACKAGFLIVKAQLCETLLWAVWLTVNVFQVWIAKQKAVTFLHTYSKPWASCMSSPHPSCLPSTEHAWSLFASIQQNIAIFFSGRRGFSLRSSLVCFCYSSLHLPSCCSPLAYHQFTTLHPFLFCLVARLSTTVSARNGRNVHQRVCSSSCLKDCGQLC